MIDSPKYERLIYAVVMISQCLIIIFLATTSHSKKNIPQVSQAPGTTQQLYSFWGRVSADEKRLIQFSAYAKQSYIFVILSSQCLPCEEFLNHSSDIISTLTLKRGTEEFVEIIILVQDSLAAIQSRRPGCTVMELSSDDIFQFGQETPIILAVNGKGQILSRHVGYKEGIFNDALYVLKESTKKRSQVIQ